MRIDDDARRIRVVLLDIEGTTTPIDFVTKTLFPYAAAKVDRFLRDHAPETEIQRLIADLRSQREADEKSGLNPPSWRSAEGEPLQSAIVYLHWLMSRDSKSTPLKTLQGKIWEEGYARGDLQGEVYEDVPRAMDRWREQGRNIAIYSSGSVLAQRLLFSTTKYGDLTRNISAYFDTGAGPKVQSSSYVKIAASLSQRPADILFLSDAEKEIEAARTAGMHIGLCVRPPATSSRTTEALFTFDGVFPA